MYADSDVFKSLCLSAHTMSYRDNSLDSKVRRTNLCAFLKIKRIHIFAGLPMILPVYTQIHMH